MINLYPLIISWGTKLAYALLGLAIGLWVIDRVVEVTSKTMDKKNVDESIKPFIKSLLKIGLKVLLGISIASMLGAEMTSFIAVLGSIGFAIGMALQGSLANFAGGVLLLTLKPFKVGNYIEAAGHSGTVKEIQLFYTILNTPDNQKVIIPNAKLSNESSVNYSANSTRRINLTYGIGYDDDIKQAKKVLEDIVTNHPKILKEPGCQIVVGEHGASSVNLFTRVWVNTSDYWEVYFELNEHVKLAFDEHGINIPYPQMDVHMIK